MPIFTEQDEWRKRSIEIIKPLKAYVWLDDFQKWFDKQTYAYQVYKFDEFDDSKVIVGPGIKLSLSPLLQDHERYLHGEAKLLKERQKATARIKASRVAKSDLSNQKILDNQLSDLVEESGLQNAEEFEYSFNLYVWRRQLADELKTITPKDYQDKKDYDDRIRALNLKIEEIDQFINSRPVSNATAKAVVEWNETLNNGQPIDWGYWKDLNNLTPVQAAKLAHMIDPVLWPNDRYAAGKPYNNRYNGEKIDNDLSIKIQRLEQRLENHSLKWNLVGLVDFLGEDNTPFGMLQATSGSIGGCLEGNFNTRLNSLEEADKAIDEEIKACAEKPVLSSTEPDSRLKFIGKFGETLKLSELIQRWKANYNGVNELAFAEKIKPYMDGRAAFVCELDGKRTFLFSSLPTDEPCIIEDVADCPKYETLPDDTYFYWPDILSFEEKHPELKIEQIEEVAHHERHESDEKVSKSGQVVAPPNDYKPSVAIESTSAIDGPVTQTAIISESIGNAKLFEVNNIHEKDTHLTRKQIVLMFNKLSDEQWRGHFSREKDNGLIDIRQGERKKPKYLLNGVTDWLKKKAHYTEAEIKMAIKKYNEPSLENAQVTKSIQRKSSFGNELMAFSKKR